MIKKQRRIALFIVTIFLLQAAGSPTLLTQEPPPEPPRASEAGTIDQQIFEEAEKELKKGDRKKPEIKKPAEPTKPVPREPELKFFVREIELRGNDQIITEELRPFLPALSPLLRER